MRVQSLILVAALALAADARAQDRQLRLPRTAACLSSPEFQTEQTLLVLDRTTPLDLPQAGPAVTPPTRARFNAGVDRIIGDRNVVGNLHVLEIRETAIGARDLGYGCLDRFNTLPPPPRKIGALATAGAWAGDVMKKLLPADPTAGDAAARRASAAQGHRRRTAAILKAEAAIDNPTRSESEVARALAEAIQTYCEGRQVCRVYVFSDLLDSQAKAVIRERPGQAFRYGLERGKQLAADYGMIAVRTRLELTVWGFGRSDARPGEQLPDRARETLHEYWAGLLGEFSRGFAHGSFTRIRTSYAVQ